MLTPDEQLFAAVVAAPDDDAPRLVYADFLEEQGRLEQATFVRAQLAAAGQPAWSVAALTAQNAARPGFVTPTLTRFHAGPTSGTWRRGFPATLQCSFADALRLDERTLSLVDSLAVNIWGVPELTPLVRLPWFPRLRSLQLLMATVDERLVRPLLDARLDALALTPTGGALATVLAAPLGLGLRALDVSDSFFTAFGRPLLDAFATVEALPRLRSLGLGENSVTAEVLAAVLAKTPNLEHLDLEHCLTGSAIIAPLLEWRGASQLRSLGLAAAQPRSEGLEHLTSAALSLRVLDLRGAMVGARGVRAVCRLPQLALLNLDKNPLDERALGGLASEALVALSLHDVPATSVPPLARLPSLRFLNFAQPVSGLERFTWPKPILPNAYTNTGID